MFAPTGLNLAEKPMTSTAVKALAGCESQKLQELLIYSALSSINW